MNILCIGDVYGKYGTETVLKNLSKIKRENNIDLVIANGENSAEGNGILPSSASTLFTAGVDVITGGNHTLRRKEIFEQLEENERLLRPANYPASVPGQGLCIVDMGYIQVAVINIMGVVYMENMACPFDTADIMIEKAKSLGAKIIVIDFHAEATSEKRALGYYLDGKISALFGTHTHVQTSDNQILPKGTGYITDIGMTGVKHSVLGADTELVIKKMKDKLPVKFAGAVGETELCGCIFEIDNQTGLTTKTKLVKI